MKIWGRLKWNISSKALECRFSFSLFEAKLRIIFFISPIHPSMVQYSILKSNNLENEFFFSTRLGTTPKMIFYSYCFATLISHFVFSFVASQADIRRRKSRNAKSTQFMYEIIQSPPLIATSSKKGIEK